MQLLDTFEKYFYSENAVGEEFVNGFWIKSNKYYVFFGKDGKTYSLVSKKYYMTVELSKMESVIETLDIIGVIVEEFRKKNDLELKEYEFWLPGCLVNGNKVETHFLARCYGVSKDLALDYLIQYDDIFRGLYDKKTGHYFGLPIFTDYDEAKNYIIRDNTKKYLKGLKTLKKLQNK